MSDIKIQPSATGSAVVTLTAPTTGTARTVTLPDATGELLSTAGGTLTGGLSGTTAAFSSTITANGQAQLNNNNLIGTNTGATSEWIAKRTSSGEGIHITTTNASGADTQRLAITCNADSADFIVKDSDIVFGTAGKGIVLGTTSNTDANTLDDYEEGTWTPTITFGGNAASIAYSTQTGHYTKVGRAVHIYGHVALSSKGSSTGHLNIRGLPFTPAGDYCPVALRFQNLSFADMATGIISSSAPASVLFYETSNGGTETTLTNSNAADNTRILFSCTYFT